MNCISFLNKIVFISLICAIPTLLSAQTEKAGVPYFSDPALSPDATEIAFVSGGDIWTVPATGGEARLLVSHPNYDSRPLYSPDGRHLAFISTRTGNGDIYVLTIASGQLNRLTYDDALDDLSAWSADGKFIYFSSFTHDIAGMRDIYRVRFQGGTPMVVSNDRYVNEYFPSPSHDGKTIAFSARGIAAAQWWRNGHSHIDESEIWLKNQDNGSYEKITERGAKHLWPMWGNDGALYYISDKTGHQNLYVKPKGGIAKQLTLFKDGRVVWPTISNNGKSIAFERDFKIWVYDIANGKAKELNIVRRGVPSSPGIDHVRLTTQFRDLSLSPDGKKAAFTARGDVFVASVKDGGDAIRVTNTTGIESQIVWANNSNTVVYVSNREGVRHLYQYNFITNTETKLTNDKTDDSSPKFSPDGKILSFIRNGQELRTIEISSKKETLIAKGYIERSPFTSSGTYSWSPDGKWIAYAAFGTKSFHNVYVVHASGGESRAVSFLANSFTNGVSWGKDSKFILFNTGQRTENSFVARVDLVPQSPRFREDQFQSLFTETSPATSKTTSEKITAPVDTMFKNSPKTEIEKPKVVWEGLRQRLSFVPLGVDVNEHAISPDGNTLVVIASAAGQANIFSYSLDELSKEPAVLKQITSTPSFKSSLQFSPDGKEVFFIEQGRIQSVVLDSRQAKSLSIVAELDIDFSKDRLEVFKQAWNLQNNGFYDPHFHGANWNAIKDTYAPLAAGANTPEELRRILAMMVGELNASHLGVSGPPAQFNVGKLGLDFERDEYEKEGKLKITEVVTLGPAHLSGKISVGDYLSAIDGISINAVTNIHQLLENKTGKMVSLTIISGDNQSRKVSVRPISLGIEKGLLYKQWVHQQREYVTKITKGRLGYVHMFDMGQESLDQLYIDMDAENHSKDGVVVDIRNNNGGFVNAYALDVLSRKGYMTMTVRGLPSAPARVQLGQRALDAPTILVTNQHSLSDAEDFSEGYRTLKLGKIVGEPTSGWIIYTSNITLFDGTVVRLPFVKITDNEGKNMELNPRPVDIHVSNPLGERNKDSQLDMAAAELLRQIDGKK